MFVCVCAHTCVYAYNNKADTKTAFEAASSSGINDKHFPNGRYARRKLVLDIGANIGYFSFGAIQLGAQVFAFEPVSRHRQKIYQGMLANRIAPNSQLIVFPYGLSNVTSNFTLDNQFGEEATMLGHPVEHESDGNPPARYDSHHPQHAPTVGKGTHADEEVVADVLASSNLLPRHAIHQEIETVEVRTLDNVLVERTHEQLRLHNLPFHSSATSSEMMPHVYIMKLDCEGHELRILQGAKQLLFTAAQDGNSGGVDHIFFEFGPWMLQNQSGPGAPLELLSLIARAG
eukprot:gene14134-16718_t